MVLEPQCPAELVADERADDREPGAVAVRLSPLTVVGNAEERTPIPSREADPNFVAAVFESILEELREHERKSRSASTLEGDRLDLRFDVLLGSEPLDEHGAQPLDQLPEIDVIVPLLRQDLVHRGDREDSVTESSSALRASVPGARAWRRRRAATV